MKRQFALLEQQFLGFVEALAARGPLAERFVNRLRIALRTAGGLSEVTLTDSIANTHIHDLATLLAAHVNASRLH